MGPAGDAGPALGGVQGRPSTRGASHRLCESGSAGEHRPVPASHWHISECRMEWPPVEQEGLGNNIPRKDMGTTLLLHPKFL